MLSTASLSTSSGTAPGFHMPNLRARSAVGAPAVHERVGKLESAGVIRGYHAVLAARREGQEIESCYFMAGEESFPGRARVKAIGDPERHIVDPNRVRGVARTRTTIALSTKWKGRIRPAS
jgi:Lrp/AsnC family leucine-responsive transcriptional regulator